jgi:3-hydroxyacyl-[acyl-carrier-protein] dehydratase
MLTEGWQSKMNKEEIKKIIPYAEPFLFVDEAEIIGENEISGFYQTSKDDYYFKGHFVDFKIMPGVLVVEALAQLSTILLRKKIGSDHKNYHFLAYDVRSVQFLKPIFPGEKIILKAEVLGIYPVRSPNSSESRTTSKASNGVYPIKKSENKIAHIKSRALVNNDLKCEARFSVVIIDKKDFEAKYR